MGELKNAWEIAQERANRLGKLSAEEREQQERRSCWQIGQALGQRWLDSSQQLDMTGELNKHEEKERDIIKQAVVEQLVESIGFTTIQGINRVKKVLEGIISLRAELQPKVEEIGKLVQEYEGAERKIRHELESICRESLHQLRVSGTAVAAINIEASPQWQLAQQRLVEVFAPRLNDLKQGLINSP